eukprot:2803929-Rhodomonas_salina.1
MGDRGSTCARESCKPALALTRPVAASRPARGVRGDDDPVRQTAAASSVGRETGGGRRRAVKAPCRLWQAGARKPDSELESSR